MAKLTIVKLDIDTDNGEVYAILYTPEDFEEFMQSCPDRMPTQSWGKSGQFEGAGLYRTESLSTVNHVIYRKAMYAEAKKLHDDLRRLTSLRLQAFADKITFN